MPASRDGSPPASLAADPIRPRTTVSNEKDSEDDERPPGVLVEPADDINHAGVGLNGARVSTPRGRRHCPW